MRVTTVGEQAVVLGASMAGLLASRVLSDHFERVTLIDRDDLTETDEPRKGVPQGSHTHVLLDQGRNIVEGYFPGLTDEIERNGGLVFDPGQQLIWHQAGGYMPKQETGLRFLSVTRPFLERHVRARVEAIDNVEVRSGRRFADYLHARARVTGVRVENPDREVEELVGDLVVDAMGRNSPTPKWLDGAGFQAPEDQMVTVHMGYATRLWQRDPSETPRGYMIQPIPPDDARGGFLLPIEGDRWITTIGGWGDDNHAPTDDEGYLAFAGTLAAPDIHTAMSSLEPISPVRRRKFPSSIRRYYERISRYPDGLIVIGDAISSFNPIYGQGMASSAMQAEVLDQEIRSGGLDTIHRRYFERAAAVVDIPWTQAVGADFRFRTTEGKKPPRTDLVNRYVSRFNRAMNGDARMARAWIDVVNLTRPARSLFAPRLAWRAIRGRTGE
jgi:2-polyprenyl-6-methoxyphenol hydroxylase-like FAD-dependent oxidoreductase